ncbi:hypothetical protein F5Y16DRAFT_393874 [Xylariaceae sp. FL0255]|nr:hypothetical protein F5Y16DRAFT_393874 [Xylariaceae sp. FL0255]
MSKSTDAPVQPRSGEQTSSQSSDREESNRPDNIEKIADTSNSPLPPVLIPEGPQSNNPRNEGTANSNPHNSLCFSPPERPKETLPRNRPIRPQPVFRSLSPHSHSNDSKGKTREEPQRSTGEPSGSASFGRGQPPNQDRRRSRLIGPFQGPLFMPPESTAESSTSNSQAAGLSPKPDNEPLNFARRNVEDLRKNNPAGVHAAASSHIQQLWEPSVRRILESRRIVDGQNVDETLYWWRPPRRTRSDPEPYVRLSDLPPDNEQLQDGSDGLSSSFSDSDGNRTVGRNCYPDTRTADAVRNAIRGIGNTDAGPSGDPPGSDGNQGQEPNPSQNDGQADDQSSNAEMGGCCLCGLDRWFKTLFKTMFETMTGRAIATWVSVVDTGLGSGLDQ